MNFVLRQPRAVAASGVAFLLLFGLLYAQNQPRYRYAEHLPEHSEASRALGKIDHQLAGANTIRILLQWTVPQDMLSPSRIGPLPL